jgi:hypothetical protein
MGVPPRRLFYLAYDIAVELPADEYHGHHHTNRNGTSRRDGERHAPKIVNVVLSNDTLVVTAEVQDAKGKTK